MPDETKKPAEPITDRTLLIDGLAGLNSATDMVKELNVLRLGSLILHFDAKGKLIRVRITQAAGPDRLYLIREPKVRKIEHIRD
jgi:hypothetical protein